MEKQRQLYDIDTVAVWTPNDNADTPLSSSEDSQALGSTNLQHQLDAIDRNTKRKAVRWKQWFLRRVAANISPLFLTTSIPSGIASSLTPLRSPWQISQSPDSQFLAVNHEDKIEFRTFNSSYEIVYAVWGANKKQDLYPKWRKIAWSLDSRLVARSFSDGTVEIIDVKGRLIGTILPKDDNSPVEDENNHDNVPGQLFVEPLSYLGFTNVRKTKTEHGLRNEFHGHEYAYELVTISYDGILRSYLFNTPQPLGHHDYIDSAVSSEDLPMNEKIQHRRSLLATQSLLSLKQTAWSREGFNDPGFFCLYHKFSFQPWFRTVACANTDEGTGIICVGGTPHKPTDADDTHPGVQFWAMERNAPYYRRYKADGQLESPDDNQNRTTQSSAAQLTGLAAVGPTLQKLFERENALSRQAVHAIVIHERYGALSLDCLGSLTWWTLSKERGGVAKTTWDSERLNYYARSKEHSSHSFESFQDIVKEYQANGTTSLLIGVLNGRCVSMRFWSKDAILLGYESGAMIVLQIPELINILGQEPRAFASCLEFTNSGFSAHDEQVFVMEEITRLIRARVVGDRWIMMTDQEDKALGEPTEEEIAQMMGNERLLFKWIAQLSKYFESKDSSKQQKLILVPKRTLTLYRMLRVPPEEYLYRKLEAKEYSSALTIATTYELNTDIIYQYQWRQLSKAGMDVVSTLLDKITDKQWVLASCLDNTMEDLDSIRVLLEYGLQLTETLMDDIVERCQLKPEVKIDWIRAAASGEPMGPKTGQALLAAQLTEKETVWCKYRWYFLKYLNRLSTFTELTTAEKESRAREEANALKARPVASQPNDPLDPLGVLHDDYSEQRPPLPLLTGSYASFKDIDLSGLARVYAEAKFIEGVRILFIRHNRETWPWRLAILDRIPETCPTELYKDLVPKVDAKSKIEKPWAQDHPWRDLDWVEVPEFRTLVFGSTDHEMDAYMAQQALTLEERKAAHGGNEAASLDMVTINKETQEIVPSPLPFPASGETLSQWYIDRALEIDRNTGQILEERRLIQCGVDNHIPQLEAISEDVEILCKLIYGSKPDSRNPQAKANWVEKIMDLSLEQFSVMNPMEVVQLCLAMSDEFTIVQDIRRLVLPYLTVVIPRRWQRNDPMHRPGMGLPEGQDPHNPMSYLYAYLLSQSPNHLSWVGAVVQASKPVFEVEERIISNDMDLSWLTMSCMYGCRTFEDWKVMSDMIVCLPMFEQTEEVDEAVDKIRRAQLRKDIFVPSSNDHSTSSAAHDRPRIPQQLDPLNMYPAFVKYAPTKGLMQHALDTLEQHLTAAETLARYDLPVLLSWFLENSDSENSQLQMVIKMARLASGGPERMGERFESEDEWMLLLEDLIRLRGGEKGGGVFGLVSEQDIYKEYLAGVLSCGKFGLAKAVLFPPGLLPPIRLATAEKLVIDCSNEMYNNATSGNRHQGLMKMSYDCLKVLPETTNIRKEMDLIEATNFMTSTYNLTAPGTNTTILPIQIRATENRLTLVRRLVMTQENAYRDHADMLELAIKVTGIGQKKSLRQLVEIQVVSMLIEAALNDRNYVFALNQSERLMELLKLSGAVDLNADGSPKVRRVVKSNSFYSGEGNGQEDDGSRPESPAQPSSRPASRAGSSMISQGLPLANISDPDTKRPWEIFVQVGSDSEGREYYKRLTVVGYALACCPAEKLESVMELWRSLEMESVHAPVTTVDPRRGVVGFMSNMIDRAGSASSGLSASGLGYGSGYNPTNAIVVGTGAVSGSGPGNTTTGQGPAKRGQVTNVQEGGRRRDKLKSLVSSIWATQ
ncbi:secretory pathway protein Sec39-domain-containing protein [Mortierella sp. GBAus27b]|nr:secretory pathway protein Sec39-domain-containing protein [Mortierella sp. GBAus27b]